MYKPRKSKQRIAEVAQAWLADLQTQFPAVEAEIILDAFEGYDVWVRVSIPPELEDRHLDIVGAGVELTWKYSDATGIEVLGTAVDKEPALA